MVEYLIAPADCASHSRDNGYFCDGSCSAPVKMRPALRDWLKPRWFITMGHAGFNSYANNRDGYASEKAARAAMDKYSGKSHPFVVRPGGPFRYFTTLEAATTFTDEYFRKHGVVLGIEDRRFRIKGGRIVEAGAN